MKKRMKVLICSALSVMAVGFAVTASSCGAKDWLEKLTCKHDWEVVELLEESTCSDYGKADYKCAECGKEKTDVVEKLDHTPTLVEHKEATCDEDGYMSHSVCSVCEEVISPLTLIPKKGHKTQVIKGTEADCVNPGKSDGEVCTVCGDVVKAQETIPTTGHNIVTIPGKAATCSEDGLTDGQECENCGEVLVVQETIPANSERHYDSNGDGFCDSCEQISAVSLEVGDTLSEGWYLVDLTNDGIEILADDNIKVTIMIYNVVGGIGLSVSSNPPDSVPGALRVIRLNEDSPYCYVYFEYKQYDTAYGNFTFSENSEVAVAGNDIFYLPDYTPTVE